MPPLTEQAHQFVRAAVRPGEIVIDATAGNGHDTCFLAELVGAEGTVYALDLQSEAISRTRQLLQEQGFQNVHLIQRDHAELHLTIPGTQCGRVAGVMLNLGYLPGGNKGFVTRADSTLRAIDAALAFLRPDGVLTVLAYTGHPGGLAEANAVAQHFAALSKNCYAVSEPDATNDRKPAAPRLFMVCKR